MDGTGGNNIVEGLDRAKTANEASLSAAPIPENPFPGQKTKGCDRRAAEVFIPSLQQDGIGACWMEVVIPDRKPGETCGVPLYEYAGKCYYPARRMQDEGDSIQR